MSEKDHDPFAPPVPRETTPRTGHTFDPLQPLPDHMQPAPLPKRKRGALKDVDTSETAFKAKAFMWSGTGAVMAMFLAMGLAIGSGHQDDVVTWMIAGFFLGWAVSYIIGMSVATGAGSGAAAIYMPSGSTTPMDRQYSLAQSYVARGRFAEAAAEYERAAVAFPTDPEPCLRLARVYRDELHQLEDAVLWFKRTCAVPNVSPGTDMMASREMIEVYTHRMRQPSAALPYLARLAARHPGTSAGEWAKKELAAMKAEMREEMREEMP